MVNEKPRDKEKSAYSGPKISSGEDGEGKTPNNVQGTNAYHRSLKSDVADLQKIFKELKELLKSKQGEPEKETQEATTIPEETPVDEMEAEGFR